MISKRPANATIIHCIGADVSWFCLLGQYDFAVWTMHFLMMSKRPTNASLIQCIGA
jgi:hypothetical protein